MIGTYGSSAVIMDPRTSQDYFSFLFQHSAGYHTVNRLSKRGFSEKFYSLRDLLRTSCDGMFDCYCSLNSFLSPRRKKIECSGRKVDNLKHLNALYVDIDCYKTGLLPEQVLYTLQEDYYNRIIPVPSLVISSGRGLYLIWKIDEDRNALPRWQKIENELIARLKEFGSDPQASDAARILRIPNTINSKSGQNVSVLEFHEVQYTLYEIAQEFDIQSSGRGKPTFKQIRTAKMLATAFQMSYPNLDSYEDTATFIAEHLPLYKEQKEARNITTVHNLDERKALSALIDGRIKDLRRLFSMRKGGDCCREYALFLCRIWMLDQTDDPEIAKAAVLRLNAMMDQPLDPAHVLKLTASAEKKWRSGNGYRYSTDRVVEKLRITAEEQAEMVYLRTETEDARIRKQKCNRSAYIKKLGNTGKTTKSIAIDQRRIKMRQLLNDGCTMEEICSELGVSERTYARDKAAILAMDSANDRKNAASTPDEAAELAAPRKESACDDVVSVVPKKRIAWSRVPKIQHIYYMKSLISGSDLLRRWWVWFRFVFGAW